MGSTTYSLFGQHQEVGNFPRAQLCRHMHELTTRYILNFASAFLSVEFAIQGKRGLGTGRVETHETRPQSSLESHSKLTTASVCMHDI